MAGKASGACSPSSPAVPCSSDYRKFLLDVAARSHSSCSISGRHPRLATLPNTSQLSLTLSSIILNMAAVRRSVTEKNEAQASHEDHYHADEKARLEELDDAVLRAQGHESALERSFSWLGATGLAVR